MFATGVLFVDFVLNFLLMILYASLGLMAVFALGLAVFLLIGTVGELYGNYRRNHC